MRYMLDTCAFIDATTDYELLGQDVCALMEDYDNQFCISIETVKEVILKYKARNLWNDIWSTAESIVDSVKADYRFTVLPMSEELLRTYANLQLNEVENHKDPSDHLIISHAITNRIPLISRDRKFLFYKSQGLDLIYYGRK